MNIALRSNTIWASEQTDLNKTHIATVKKNNRPHCGNSIPSPVNQNAEVDQCLQHAISTAHSGIRWQQRIYRRRRDR